jgi:hypothetical protein
MNMSETAERVGWVYVACRTFRTVRRAVAMMHVENRIIVVVEGEIKSKNPKKGITVFYKRAEQT